MEGTVGNDKEEEEGEEEEEEESASFMTNDEWLAAVMVSEAGTLLSHRL